MRFFEFPVRRTDRPEEGQLQFIEEERHVPFRIRRVYYSTGVRAGCVRGKHAHRTLQQALICVCGAVRIDLDDGESATTCVLDNPALGLYVGPMMWHTMTWVKDGSVLLVLASDLYNEADYVRSYDDFRRLVARRGEEL